MSFRKSSIQQSTHATVPIADAPTPTFQFVFEHALAHELSAGHVVVVEVTEELHQKGRRSARMAALMPSNTLASTPSGLSDAFTRYGPSVPMSYALRTRLPPYFPMYRVTSPEPIENPTSATFFS